MAYQEAVIESGSAVSAAVDMDGKLLVGIEMPSSWTTADLTFQAARIDRSANGDFGTYLNVYEVDTANTAGVEVTVDAAASRYLGIDNPAPFAGIQSLKVRSGTSGTPVNQGADRTLRLHYVSLGG